MEFPTVNKILSWLFAVLFVTLAVLVLSTGIIWVGQALIDAVCK